MKLCVQHTWDGQALPAWEQVQIEVIEVASGLSFEVDAPWHGDPLPSTVTGPCWALWEHEVVEVFVVGAGTPVPYTEIEIGPAGHHLVLQLRGVRTIVARELPLALEVRREGVRWRARALLAAELLPPRPWRLFGFAIHGLGWERRYLASTPVPGVAPDFHRVASGID